MGKKKDRKRAAVLAQQENPEPAVFAETDLLRIKNVLGDLETWRKIASFKEAFEKAKLPQTELQLWGQTEWWPSIQSFTKVPMWNLISEMTSNHINNVLGLIHDQPRYFTDQIHEEIVREYFNTRFDTKGPHKYASLVTLLQGSLDLMWVRENPLEFLQASPLYKALKAQQKEYRRAARNS